MSDIAAELARLHLLTGAEFSRKVEEILNMGTRYNARLLAKDLMYYFHINPSAIEVIIFKGSQLFLVKRIATEDKDFVKKFIQKYNK